jgi:uncharacterized protein YeaO (DUF488 family)
MTTIKTKRIYDPAEKADGQRVLVDRIWPRGITKEKAALDFWLRDIAPSTELRKWFGHKPERWVEFDERFRKELVDNPALSELKAIAKKGTVTLVYAAKDTEHNNAMVLQHYLTKHKG